jgi:hypothetical protein
MVLLKGLPNGPMSTATTTTTAGPAARDIARGGPLIRLGVVEEELVLSHPVRVAAAKEEQLRADLLQGCLVGVSGVWGFGGDFVVFFVLDKRPLHQWARCVTVRSSHLEPNLKDTRCNNKILLASSH